MSKSITRVKREKDRAFKPLVYICAPYSGEIQKNTEESYSFTFEDWDFLDYINVQKGVNYGKIIDGKTYEA